MTISKRTCIKGPPVLTSVSKKGSLDFYLTWTKSRRAYEHLTLMLALASVLALALASASTFMLKFFKNLYLLN